MKETEIKKALIDAYGKEKGDNKKFLEKLFGKSFFDLPIIERDITFEDICKERGDTPEEILPYKTPKNKRQFAANDLARLDYIAEFLQQGFIPDYSNENEKKWFPYFEYNNKKAGFGFSDSLCVGSGADSTCGSRLALKNKETSDYFGTQFIEIHNRLLTNKY